MPLAERTLRGKPYRVKLRRLQGANPAFRSYRSGSDEQGGSGDGVPADPARQKMKRRYFTE